ncbi:MAG: zinc dependent phospholipase C family protein, partial [Erysipelotrichia bacterium]|nr:zinc dependent phospholipase C family protein [Erysipelotrichia bacterium]
MPSVLSHCLCGEEAVTNCNIKSFKQIIKENDKIFYLGCQGPDPFMFYHHFPFQNKERAKTVRNCSRLIHKGRVNDFFNALLKYAKKKGDRQLFVYIGGFFSHHALDSIAHPYVNYQTGSAYKNNLRLHQIFESQIDLALLKLKGIKPEDYRADKKIVKLKDSAEKIAEMLSHCIKEVFDYEVTIEDVKDSLDDMARAEKVFAYKKGKYRFFKYLEKLMKKPNVVVNMMMPLEYDEKMDAMNYGRELWHSPVDLTFASNETFMELYDKATSQTSKILELLEKYIDNEIDEKQILEIVGNRNYDSGSSDGSKMKYFKLDSGIKDYEIRLMELKDLDKVVEIYKEAREFMRETG